VILGRIRQTDAKDAQRRSDEPNAPERPSLLAVIRADAIEVARYLDPVSLGVLSMVFASGVAAIGEVDVSFLSFLCTGQRLQGANINDALALAFFGGLAGAAILIVLSLMSRVLAGLWRPLIAAVLLLEAATLGLAIAFVALDSATYVERGRVCGSSTGTSKAHFGYLYALWAVSLAIVLFAASRVVFEIVRSGRGRNSV
jgi:hypothetical protein